MPRKVGVDMMELSWMGKSYNANSIQLSCPRRSLNRNRKSLRLSKRRKISQEREVGVVIGVELRREEILGVDVRLVVADVEADPEIDEADLEIDAENLQLDPVGRRTNDIVRGAEVDRRGAADVEGVIAHLAPPQIALPPAVDGHLHPHHDLQVHLARVAHQRKARNELSSSKLIS